MSAPGRINIILFWFMNDWGKYGRTYENVARTLSRHPRIKRVIVVLPPLKVTRMLSFPCLVERETNSLYVVTPHAKIIDATGSFYRLRNWINENLPQIAFRGLMKILGCYSRQTIMWVYPPNRYISQLLHEIPYSKLVSQIVDNNLFLDSLSELNREFVKTQYYDLARKSDVVITSSESNQSFFSKLNSNTHLFINAVDSKFIGEARDMPYKSSEAKPRLVYVGWISQRTDVELLKLLAEKRSGYHLIIAGPDEGRLQASGILALPNVEYLGVVPYKELPMLLHSVDVCLMPHLDNDYSRAMSPLKLFQYLASGRPIVSTNVGGVDVWSEWVMVAKTHDEFIAAIDRVLLQDNIELSAKRIAAAMNETWSRRVDDMLSVIL